MVIIAVHGLSWQQFSRQNPLNRTVLTVTLQTVASARDRMAYLKDEVQPLSY